MSEADIAPANWFSYNTCTLADGDIRLLEPTDKADGLHWNLRTAPVDDPTLDYDALSYVWGSNLQTFPIVCNGQPLKVHGNLYTALPFLARRCQGAKTRPIWIDAVCINQNDEGEKLIQIKMMNKVYQNAQMVWVWLGLAEKQARIPEAIDLLPKILVASEQTPEYFSGPRTAEEMEFVKANNLNLGNRYNFLSDSYGLNHIQPDVWSAVMHIMDNPWCHRVWVVQEAALAKDITFLCGEHRIEFTLLRDVVCSTLVHLYILDTEGRQVDFNGRNSEYVYYARKLVQDRVASTTLRTGPVELSKIARWAAEHQDCRYPQDRVLGVLGLVDEKFLARIGHALQTYMGDYSSIAQLYTMFTEYLLTNINAQDISWWWWLNTVFTYGRNKDLPSWVPDLHKQAEKYQCRPYSDMMQFRQEGQFLYKASRRHAKGRLGPGSGELTLNGTIIDQISYVHAQQPTCPQGFFSTDSNYANLAGKIRYVIDTVNWEKTVAEISVHCTGKRDEHDQGKGTHRKCVKIDDYWRTLLADITKQDGATFTYKTYTDFCTIYRKATHTMSTFDIAERQAAGIELFLGVDEEKQIRSVYQEMQNGSGAQGFFTHIAFLQDRQLFLTKNGKIGFTLKGVQEGDLVCVFNNAWVPHVLRRANDRESEKYRFVGDAYVHGLMYGAADEMNLEVRDITLVWRDLRWSRQSRDLHFHTRHPKQ